MPEFVFGSTDPLITPDAGAGEWNVETISADTVAFRLAFAQFWPGAVVLIGDDAVSHMFHYFKNDGSDLTIDLDGMVTEVPSAKALYDAEVAAARQYVEGLPIGRTTFTSRRAVNGYNGKKESSNWFFAIGGYSVWSKGTAIVSAASGGQRSYDLQFEYKFFDRYNWDGGKQVELFGVVVTDEFMGRMHREGLAREYNCYGTLRKRFEWGAPAAVTTRAIPVGAGR
jgi:hypothetical protein